MGLLAFLTTVQTASQNGWMGRGGGVNEELTEIPSAEKAILPTFSPEADSSGTTKTSVSVSSAS